MTDFTPVSALVGGLLIGLSASLLLWLNGRIAGISGVLGGLLWPGSGDRAWRGWFLAGLVLGGGGYYLVTGVTAPIRLGFPVYLLLLAGFLTGFGSARANGCTSGHGVCGLARLSLRSLVATATLLIAAIATTYVVRHIVGVSS
ncbi:MAG TPA: YeeE/YedE family protein [Rhodoferax sp.]|nr:YeeE/YedE family protein [Rhodoferax sp.]